MSMRQVEENDSDLSKVWESLPEPELGWGEWGTWSAEFKEALTLEVKQVQGHDL